MKILKFNENNKFLNTPWTEEKFKEIQKLENEIERTKRSLYPLLAKYIKLHPELEEDPDLGVDLDKIKVIGYYLAENVGYKMSISYTENYSEEVLDVSLDKEQFQDLIIFLQDPEMYINANKYNL